MHRSGTSALSGALDAAGLTAGKVDGLTAADRRNPAGYYEQLSIAQLNDEILSHFGGGWDCPPELAAELPVNTATADFVARASQLMDTCFAGESYTLKDPRITVLLPFWRRALLDRCSVVMIVRNPAEVAWSLHLRDGIPLLTGLALWSAYNRAALTGLDGLPVHLCSYEDLVNAPLQTLQTVIETLQAWGDLGEEVDITTAADRIKSDLRRQSWPRGREQLLDLPEEVEALEKLLEDRIGRHNQFEPVSLSVPWWEQPLLDERRRGFELNQSLQSARQELLAHRDQMNQLEANYAATSQQTAHLEQQLRDTRLALDNVTTERDETQADAARTLQALEEELSLWKARSDRFERILPVRLYLSIRRCYLSARRRRSGSSSSDGGTGPQTEIAVK
jgi:hypothetical protein